MIHISKGLMVEESLKVPIMERVCDRVRMARIRVKAGYEWTPDLYPRPGVTQMLLFLGGSGYVRTETKAFTIKEPALFVPEFDKEAVTVRAGKEDLNCLQIVSVMNEEDGNQINKSHMIFPRFRPFSEAWEHTMNTIDAPDSNARAFVLIENRKLGANNMGIFRSASRGVTKITEDILPAYDQFIIGLQGAKYTAFIGGEAVEIQERDVAFIPRNTPFRFESGENGMVHHVWYSLNCCNYSI